MPNVALYATGIAAVVGINVLQLIMPFAFDFLSTLAAFGLGAVIARREA